MRDSSSLRRVFTIIFKYKSSILWVWGVTLITIIAGNQLVAPTYEAESTIMVNFGREYLYNPEVGDDRPFNYYNRAGLINSEIEILSSRDLLRNLIQSIGIDRLYPNESKFNLPIFSSLKDSLKELPFLKGKEQGTSKEEIRLSKAIDTVIENLTVLGSKESNIIKLIFFHHDPAVAAEAVNTLVTLYQKKHLEVFRDHRVSNFLEATVKQYEQELAEAEKQLKLYKNDRAANSAGLQEEVLVRQRGSFDTLLKESQSEFLGLTRRLASLEEQKQSMAISTPLFSETNENDRVHDNAKAELLTLQLREQELLGTFREDSPQVQNIRERIRLVEAFLKDQQVTSKAMVRTGKSMAYQELETQIAMTTARQQELTAVIEALKTRLTEIDEALRDYLDGEGELQILQRQKELKEANYLTYVRKLEEAKINTEMDNQILTNIKVVHEATAPHEPAKPKKILNLLVGLILGGCAGVGISFFRNYLNQGVNLPEDLEERLNLPVLATVSYKGQ